MFVEVYQWFFFVSNFELNQWSNLTGWFDLEQRAVCEWISFFPRGEKIISRINTVEILDFCFFFLHYLLEENYFLLSAWLGLDVSRAGSKFMFLFVQFIFMKHHQTSVSTGWRFLVVWNCHLIFRNAVEADEIFLLFTVYTVNQCGLNLNWSPVFATKGQLFSQGCWLKNSVLCTIQETHYFARVFFFFFS